MKIRKIVDSSFSLGATVVIFGAWAKITHQPFADTMLTVGLLTECAIFLLYFIMDLGKGEIPEHKLTIGNIEAPAQNKELNETMKSIDNTLKQVFNR